jgi:hypothetical protein
MTRLQCPRCSAPLQIRDDLASAAYRCPACGQVLRVPRPVAGAARSATPRAAAAEPPEVYAVAQTDDPAPAPVRPRRGPRPPRRPATRSHTPGLLGPVYLGFLGVLACLWAVLAGTSWFFPIASPVGMSALGFGPVLFLIGYFWTVGAAACDGQTNWLFPIPLVRGTWLARYARENPERAARPYSLAILGGVLFLLTFALFLLKQRLGLP